MNCDIKRRLIKIFLVCFTSLLLVAVVAVLFAGIYLKNNPLANVVYTSVKTTKDSFRVHLTKTTYTDGVSDEIVKEFVFPKDFEKNGFAEISGNKYTYRTKEYVFTKDLSDGTTRLSKREYSRFSEVFNKALDYLSDGDIDEIARLLNREVFSKDVLDDELEHALMNIVLNLADEEYLEKKLGFSKTETDGVKTYSFKNDIRSLGSFAHSVVSESKFAFLDEGYHEELLDMCTVVSELKLKVDFELTVVMESGYIKNITQKITSRKKDGTTDDMVYSLDFSDFGEAVLDETVIKDFEELKPKAQ